MPRLAPRALVILCCLAAANAAYAQPVPRPSSYFGAVTVGGNPVGSGLTLSAEIGGVEYETTATFEFEGMTVYLIDVPADVPETPGVEGGVEGQTVDLLLNGVPAAETGVWSDGTYTNLDLTVPPGADLSIAKDDGVSEADPGDTLTYTLTVSNENAVDAFGVVIEDPVPVGTTFVSASDGGTESGGVVTWPAFDLAGGATASRTLVLEVAGTFPAGTAEIVNVATVASDGADGFDPEPGNNTATDSDKLNGGPDLAVTKSADRTEVRPGETIVYTLQVSNGGFQDAVDVRLTDVLPPNLIFQSATDEGAILGSIVQWPVFDLAVGATATRTYRVRLDPLVPVGFSQLVNTATVTEGANLELDPSDNTTSLTLPILEAPDLLILLVDPSGAPVDPQTLTISGQVAVELVNAGNLDLFDPFDVAIFEDVNGNRVFDPGTDNVLGTASHGAGLPARDTLTVDVPVAGTVAFRNSPLYAFVDSGQVVAEHDETNNLDTAASGCEAIPVPEDFNPVTEIAWPVPGTSESFSRDSASVPLVAQLTDDNGDGRFDENDVPDIVFVSIDLLFPFNPAPRLRAIRGDTGAELWSAPQISAFWVYALTGAAVGDIDLDGRPEIVVSMISTQTNTGSTNRLAAYEHNGVFKWFSSIYNTHPNGTSLTNRDNPSIADLDQDGVPEIIVGANVFRNNGSFKWIGSGGQGYQSARNADANDSGAISIAADLDLSGGLELVTGNTAYRADGTIYWQIPMDDGYPSIGNFDADPFPEIVVVSRGNVRLHEHDGTLIWGPTPLPGDNPEAGGAPTIGNFDADPEPEIGVAGSTQYTVFEADGSIKWQATIRDNSSNMTGSTVFDLDGDGLAEVIYRDEIFLRIFRGADGTVLYEEPFSSFTANEEAVVADVDRDGNAEIVISSNRSVSGAPRITAGIHVLGDANDNWVAARGVWNQHQYHIDNIEDDGSIPQFEAPGWQTHNTYRANVAPAGASPFTAPDLSASRLLFDLSLFPTATVTARIGNGGASPAPAGLSVAFYDGDPAAGGALLGTTATTVALAPGDFEDVSITITLPGTGSFPVFVVADDDGTGAGTVNECDEENNLHSADAAEALGLGIVKDDGLASFGAGDMTTYLLTISNSSADGRTGVAVSDTLPSGLLFVSASDGGSEIGGVVTWPLFDLAGGASAQRLLTVQVDPALDPAITSLTNTASVTDDGSVPDPTPGNNTDTDTNQVVSVSAEAGGPYAGDEGSPIAFDGSGSSDPVGTIVSYEWDFENDGTFDATGVSPSHAYPDNGIFTALLKVTSDSGEMDTDTAEVTVANVAPSVDAGADQDAGLGETVALAATFTDPGSADTHTATIDWGDGTVEPGVVDQGAGTVTGSHGYAAEGTFTVEVCVTDDDGGAGCDTSIVTVTGDPVLAASKADALAADNDGDAVPSPGDELEYAVVVSNSGSGPATGVVFSDLIPADTAVVAGSVTSTQGTVDSEDPVQVTLGEIAAGASATIAFRVLIDDPVPAGVTEVVNQGTVTSSELPAVLTDDPDLGGDQDPTVTMIAAAPLLVAEKTDALAVDADGDGVPSPGDTLEYTVTLLNNGNTSATGVVLSDPIPANTAVVAGSVTTSQGTVDSEDPVQVTVGEIAGGMATATIAFRVTVVNPVPAGVMEVVNQGTVASAELADVPTDDPDLGGDADPTATMIAAEPELVVEKVDVLFADNDGDGVASPGDELLYQVAVDNVGNTSATAVVLSDPIPAATAVVAGTVQTSQGAVLSEDPVEIDLGEIAGGSGATVSFRVVIDDPFPATEPGVANQATVTSAELAPAVSDDPDTTAVGDPTATEVFVTPAITIADAGELEADAAAGGLSFAVALSVAPNRAVSVDYATADGTALAGLDYVAASGTVVFAPGETAQAVVVSGLDDLVDEIDETFTVELANPVGATIADATGLGTILDDDAAPATSIDDVTVAEGDAGATQAVFTVSLSGPSGLDVMVDFATVDGTATAGTDYAAAAGTVTIAAGDLGATIAVDVLGDLLDEPDETYTVELAGAVNATLADASGLGTILDDDDPPALSIDDVTVVEGDAGATAAVFSVSLSGPSGLDVAVDFATADGTATAGADYTAAAGTVTIAAGDLGATIAVDVLGDLADEPDETFTVELSAPVNATLADGSGLGTILDDDEPMLPDLVIPEVDAGGLTTDPQTLRTTGTVTAVVRNDGSGAAGADFTVTFFDDVDNDGALGPADLVLAEETVIAPLAAGEERPLSVDVDYTAAFAGDLVWAFADSGMAIEESDETNNLNQSGALCEFQPPIGDFTPVLEWSWTSSSVEPSALNVMMTPAVADLDGDGTPDVVFGSTAATSGLLIPTGFLRALNGGDGSEIFTVNDPTLRIDTACGVAVGDVDLDGRPEIIACDDSGARLIAFEHDGAFKWRSPGLEAVNWGSPSIADLDGDGTPEIVVGRQALDSGGSILWTGTGGRAAQSNTGPASLVADVDLDGSPDVVAGRTVYNADGSVKWDTVLPDGYNAVGNFDADDFPEIVLVAGGQVRLLEHDGTVKWGPVAIPAGGNGGPPTIADYDADGEAEIGVAGGRRYAVFETDGTLKWAAVTQDGSSSRTGSSVFDFDGDGSAEVVYRDERFLRVYRGTDGGVLFQTAMSSCTWLEYVLVADVDADGNAEIVAVANNNCGFGPQRGVFVFGDARDNWVATRRLWNQHTYHVTNVDDDLTIPAAETPSWLAPGPNSYRAQALVSGNLFAAPDLTVSNLRVGRSGCPAEVSVTARIGNAGSNLAPAPVDVAFYQGDPAAGGILLGSAQTSVDLEPGEFEDVTLTFPAVAGSVAQVCASVDEAGAIGECSEANTACADLAPACANADLAVTKTDGLLTALAGQPIQYTVTVTNSGPEDVAELEVSDPLPAELLAPTWTCTPSGGGTCTAGPVAGDIQDTASLPAGESLVYLVEGTVDAGFEGLLTNTATVSALVTDVDPANNSATDTTEVVALPELSVVKSDALFADNDGDAVASPGDELLYTVVVSNGGNGPATGVVLTDPIPANTMVVPGSVTTTQGVIDSESPVQVTLGEIAAGAGATVTFRVAIDDPFPAGELAVANQATVTSAELPAVASDDPDTPAAGDPTATEVFITPAISIGDATELEADAAAAGLSFAVTLSVAPNREVRVDHATADGSALAGADYVATAGTVVFAPGETAQAVVVPGVDDALDEADETFTVELANPVGATLADASALGTILDDDDPPALSIDDVAVAEGDAGATAAVFTVTLSDPSGLEVIVDFATADGTATAGADYTATAGTLTIAPGDVSGTIAVDVLGDVTDEPDETYTVELSAPVNATLTDGSGLGTILDDDEAEISIADASRVEGDAGAADLLFTVSLSGPSAAPVAVDFATADGTAIAGADYLATAGTLTIPAGASEGTIAVPVLGDLLLESDETFTVELANPAGGVLADGEAEGTILDDEECPGPNLLANPGAEEPLAAGELPGWTEVLGADWQPRFDNPPPAEGVAYFFAGAVELGELAQDVDVSAYAAPIAGGEQRFRFDGFARTFDELPADTARIVVEYRDTTNTVVLDAFDSGEISSPLAWQPVFDERAAPVGTGWIRVRLLATRLGGADNDGYFDGLSLRSLRTPVLSVSDATVTEGDAGVTPASFVITLNCPVAREVSLAAATADGTALAGEDYVALAPTPVVLPAGATSATVTVDVLGDLVEEDDESFLLVLSAPVEAVIVDGRGVGTILDDDGPPFCPRSPGYWKNHLEDWPVTELQLGGVLYGMEDLLGFLAYGGPDASLKLARQLVATKLNLASGSDPAIQPVVDAADAFLAAHPPGSRPRGDAAKLALALKDTLDAYNNDPTCDSDSDSDSDSGP